jgi:hypothetical protein
MGMSWQLSNTFEDLGPGRTRVLFQPRGAPLGGFFGELGDTIVEKVDAKDVRASLEHLETFVEES